MRDKNKGKHKELREPFPSVMMYNDASCLRLVVPCINVYGFGMNIFLFCRSSNIQVTAEMSITRNCINPLNPELSSICYLLALLGAHHFLHVSRIRVKLLNFRLLMSYIYIYGAPILDVSRSHTTTQHSR